MHRRNAKYKERKRRRSVIVWGFKHGKLVKLSARDPVLKGAQVVMLTDGYKQEGPTRRHSSRFKNLH